MQEGEGAGGQDLRAALEPFGHLHRFFCVTQLHTLRREHSACLEEPARGAPLGTFGAEGGGGPTGSPRAAGMGSRLCGPGEAGCPANPQPHTPIQRLEGTAKTDFHPGNCVWWPHWPFWANGDGQYTYPGPGATPVGSVRLANLLDGLEDAELLARLEDARACELVAGVAAGLDDFANDGGRALEAARRAAAAEIMAQSEARRGAP